METILKQIQDTVIKYANVLSQVLKVDIEIVDNNLFRIAGTGEYEESINISMENEGYVYKKVLSSGESEIIKDPGRNELCIECPKYQTCIEKFEMCVPIKMEEQIIGVIGLICFTEGQKEFILGNLEIYLSFLDQIADFISAKAFETLEKEKTMEVLRLLNAVTDEIEEGVIILDKNGTIINANTKAFRILGIKKEDIKTQKVSYEHTGKFILDKAEYSLKLENETYYLVGYMRTIENKDKDNKVVFIFNETETIKNQIEKLTDMEDFIVFDNILGSSEQIIGLKNKILKISQANSTVLITGEKGVGKEMFARAIHSSSGREDMPFVAVNCGNIPKEILESELFGHIKNPLTGTESIGKFQAADGGTIFLDEIGDMPLFMQAKLLRVLQDMEVVQVGANKSVKINVRVVAATNKNLEELMDSGKFREDLYYRLSVIPIEIPPLRERVEDIKVITYYYLNKYSKMFNKKFVGLDPDVWKYLCRYNWPGNMRELQNAVEFMINMMDNSGIISVNSIPKKIREKGKTLLEVAVSESLNLKKIEVETIKRALSMYSNTKKGKQAAADVLGIGIATLYRKIDEHNLLSNK